MDKFGEKRPVVNIADALAALAIVRSLLKSLKNKNVISAKDINSIVADAVAQLGPPVNDGRTEAKRLIETLRQPV